MVNIINQDTINLVKQYEGCVLTAYPDPGSGNQPWTIGYGHTLGVHKGDVITQAQADAFLLDDLKYAGRVVLNLVKVDLNDNQYGALVSFVYNVGEGTFAKSSVLECVNKKDFDRVPGRLALYRLAGNEILQGLVKRRQAEGNLWLKSVDPSQDVVPSSTVTVNPDQNNAKPIDWPAIGALTTLLVSISNDAKNVLANVTSAIDLQPWQVLLVFGVAFAGYSLYKKFKKDR